MTKTLEDFLNEAQVLQFPKKQNTNPSAQINNSSGSSNFGLPASHVSDTHIKSMQGHSDFSKHHNNLLSSLHSSSRQFLTHKATAEHFGNPDSKYYDKSIEASARAKMDLHANNFFDLLPVYIDHHTSNPHLSKSQLDMRITHSNLSNHADDIAEATPTKDQTLYKQRIDTINKLKSI